MATYYSSVIIDENKDERVGVEVEPFKEALTRAVIKPIAVSFVFITLYRIFSN